MSGIILFAKDKTAFAALAGQFRDDKARSTFAVLVRGSRPRRGL